MATEVLTNCKILLGGYDLSGHHNQMSVEYNPEMLDDTVFGTGGTRSFKPGLKQFQFSGSGFWDSDIDAPVFARIGAVREVMSFASNPTGTWFTIPAVNATYNPMTGAVGELIAFDFDAVAQNSPLVRSTSLASGAQAASGNGTALNLGLLGAGQRAYSGLHVTAVAATSLVVIVQSDDAVGFPSPVTRITHITATGGGGVIADWQELAGPVATDTWWRSSWTIVGGPFTFSHIFGIRTNG